MPPGVLWVPLALARGPPSEGHPLKAKRKPSRPDRSAAGANERARVKMCVRLEDIIRARGPKDTPHLKVTAAPKKTVLGVSARLSRSHRRSSIRRPWRNFNEIQRDAERVGKTIS